MVWSLSLCLGAFGLCGFQALVTNKANLECVLQKFLFLNTPAELNMWEVAMELQDVPNSLENPKVKCLMFTIV